MGLLSSTAPTTRLMDPPLRGLWIMVGNTGMKPLTFMGVSRRKAIMTGDTATLNLLMMEVVRRNPAGFDDSIHDDFIKAEP